MSLRTCSWLLPQNEQRYGTLGPLLLLVDVTSPVLLPVVPSRSLFDRFGSGGGSPAGVSGTTPSAAFCVVVPARSANPTVPSRPRR